MLNFRQMEKIVSILDIIQRYETMIDQIDSGWKTESSKIDAMPTSNNPDPRRIERQLLLKEEALERLPQLRIIREAYRPRVQQTIEEATAEISKPSVRIKMQLVMKMRYEQGRSWTEIEHLMRMQNARSKVLDILGG